MILSLSCFSTGAPFLLKIHHMSLRVEELIDAVLESSINGIAIPADLLSRYTKLAAVLKLAIAVPLRRAVQEHGKLPKG